jgi:hypothetical protein
MLTKGKVLALALTLAKDAESDLIYGNEILAGQGLSDADKARVREVVDIVHGVCAGYSYLRSAAFTKETLGKSESFVAMKIKLESAPPKKKERLDELFAAIRSVQQDSQQLFELVSQDQRGSVERIISSLNALSLASE